MTIGNQPSNHEHISLKLSHIRLPSSLVQLFFCLSTTLVFLLALSIPVGALGDEAKVYSEYNAASHTLTYKFGTGGQSSSFNRDDVRTIVIDPTMKGYKPTSLFQFFSGFGRVEGIQGLGNLQTDSVEDFNYLFEGCSSLKSLNLNGMRTPSATSMAGMFKGCSSLTSLNLSTFDTGKVNNMAFMFDECSSLTSLDVTKFNTKSVTDMVGLFSGCSSLKSIDVSHFDTSSLEKTAFMFSDCSSLTSLDLSKFKTVHVSNMDGMFSGCESLKYLDITGVSSFLSSTLLMFSRCPRIEVIKVGFGFSFTGSSIKRTDPYLRSDVKWHCSADNKLYSARALPSNVYCTFTAFAGHSIGRQSMFRMYNPNSGEHFYTSNASERNHLIAAGWRFEGEGWAAPIYSNKPVYRLYNANAGDHHYTTSANERDTLVAVGWKYEGIGWYSAESNGKPLYRQYNPNAIAGSHNYTTNKGENDHLVTVGWRAEGIGWYGLK